MVTAKEEVRELLEGLPDDVALAEIGRIITLRAHLDHSRAQALRGELIDNEDVIEEMRAWRESVGQSKPAKT